jgi:hypothetical protein
LPGVFYGLERILPAFGGHRLAATIWLRHGPVARFAQMMANFF